MYAYTAMTNAHTGASNIHLFFIAPVIASSQSLFPLVNNLYQPVSNTFHGRDIFAPVAAQLTQRVVMDSLGPQLKDYVRLDWPKPQIVGGLLRGEIIYIDHFGNAISNIESPERSAGTVCVPDKVQCDLRKFYQEVPAGQPLAIPGSTGYLEIAVNGGNAAQTFSLKLGDPVELA